MKVEKTICGVRAADVRTLLRKKGERFDTPDAMRLWGLEEPEVTSVLVQMQQEGWIAYGGRKGGVDWWRETKNGRRLVATPLVKRISANQAKEILDQLIDEARAINAEEQRSRRVTNIRLS